MGPHAHDTKPRFDAQCDVAALVYGPADDPDAVLAGFVADLRPCGCRVAGLIQCGRFPQGRCSDVDPAQGLAATLLHSGREITLAHHGIPQSKSCCLEARAVSKVRDGIAAAIHHGADLLVVNRYGKLEVEGGGFLDAIALAMASDIPVIVAVPERNFQAWTVYSAGMSVKLTCSRKNLDSWWRSVSGAAAGNTSPTFCAIAK